MLILSAVYSFGKVDSKAGLCFKDRLEC